MSQPVGKVRWGIAGPVLGLGAGLIVGGAAWLASRKSNQTVEAIKQAVSEDMHTLKVGSPMPSVSLRLTGYWPFTARADEAKMEGGTKDRKGQPLHTVEDFLAGKADFVSLSGDDAVWPYGQKLVIPWTDGKMITGRVVDTGSHFRGAGKIYRVVGSEPIDVCVQSSETVVPKLVTASIFPGDNFEKGKAVATTKLKDQTVAVVGSELEESPRPREDYEALARAVESELGGRPRQEQVAAAWSMRNRSDSLGISVHAMLVPNGEYGSPMKSGGYASTRRVPTEVARAIAAEVLGAAGADDPTGGAIEFWVPEQQGKLRQLGDLHRAAMQSGDVERALRYARYAGYGSEGDIRVKHARDGLHVVGAVGVVELLGKI